MHAIRLFSWVGLGLATIAIFVAYTMRASLVDALICFAPVLIYVLGLQVTKRVARYRRRSNSVRNITFLFLVGLVIVGAMRDQQPTLLLISILSSFVFWDLDGFAMRLLAPATVRNESDIVRKHLLSLLFIVVGSSVLFALAQGLRLDVGVWTAIFLAALLVTGLLQALRYLRAGDT